ncbi:hypothetical protein, partial [Kitasatospora sp. NPDC047058]|uniref:hypothetical protein n=1 Tax=Kitasatospora sp. NPDC047058 TaxID=3155620 RepID=UPI00340A4041
MGARQGCLVGADFLGGFRGAFGGAFSGARRAGFRDRPADAPQRWTAREPAGTRPGGGRAVVTGLVLGESPRWHDGRLWVCDWGA